MSKQHSQDLQSSEETKSQTDESVLALESVQKEADLWKQKYLRALADYQNLEKRSQVREDEVRKFAGERILRNFLPSVDTLEQAAKHVDDEGLRLSIKELLAALESSGVTRMKVVGKQFDPFTMECIDVVSGAEEKVVEEVTPGYFYNEKVLRVAQVKVGKKSTK